MPIDTSKISSPVSTLCIPHDADEHKKEESRLKESEERYKTLVDNVPLCIKWFYTNGVLISVNKHAREEHFLQGKTDEEIRNWKYLDCIKPEYHKIVKDSFTKALEGHESEFDMEHVPGTSTGHWCHSNLIPARDENGNVKYILFISRDITDEKESTEQMNKNITELKRFKQLTVERELKMIELKKKIEAANQRITELENNQKTN